MTPWTVAYQAPQSVEFSRQEYWSGLPFPSPGDLPDPGIKPGFPALQADLYHLSHGEEDGTIFFILKLFWIAFSYPSSGSVLTKGKPDGHKGLDICSVSVKILCMLCLHGNY